MNERSNRAGVNGRDEHGSALVGGVAVMTRNRVKQKSELLSDQHERKSDRPKNPGKSGSLGESPNTRLVKSAMRTTTESEYRTLPNVRCTCDEAERNRRFGRNDDPRHQPLDLRVNVDGEVSCRFCWDLIIEAQR